MIGAGASALFWASLRVGVSCDGESTRIVRRVLWVVPWRTRRYDGLPDAYVDGWGDLSDPAALFVGSGEGAERVELGWSHRGNAGRAEALARQIGEWRRR